MVAHVLLMQGSKERHIFFLRRSGTGFLDGYYSLPGGHLEPGELPSEAARRECFQETGVQLEALAPRCVLPYRYRGAVGVNWVFEALSYSGVPRLAERTADAAVWAGSVLPNRRPRWIDAALAAPGASNGAGWYLERDEDSAASQVSGVVPGGRKSS